MRVVLALVLTLTVAVPAAAEVKYVDILVVLTPGAWSALNSPLPDWSDGFPPSPGVGRNGTLDRRRLTQNDWLRQEIDRFNAVLDWPALGKQPPVVRLRLAGVGRAWGDPDFDTGDYWGHVDWSAALAWVRDVYPAEWLDSNGYDIVHLVVGRSGTSAVPVGGIAVLGGRHSVSGWAAMVMNTMALAHELGHNFGLTHDDGKIVFGFGDRGDGNCASTLMATGQGEFEHPAFNRCRRHRIRQLHWGSRIKMQPALEAAVDYAPSWRLPRE